MENTGSFSNYKNQAKSASTPDKRSDRKRSTLASIFTALAAIVIVLPMILSCALLIYFQVEQRILPNVFVYDKPAGWTRHAELVSQIDELWNINRIITISSESDNAISYSFSPAALGLWVDPIKTADAALAFGRTAHPFEDILSSIRGEPHIVLPVLYFNETIARQTLTKISQELQIQPENAAIRYKNGEWIALPASTGRQVEIDKIIENLKYRAFDILNNGQVSLEIKTIEPSVIDLSFILNEIENIASRELSVIAYDPILDKTFRWTVPDEIKHSWISLNPDDNTVQLDIKDHDVQKMLDLWLFDLGEERTFQESDTDEIIESWNLGKTAELNILHNPTTYQVSAGESLWSISLKLGMPMWYILNANPGLTTNNLTNGMHLTIPSKNVLLPLPVVQNKRILVDISEQKMTLYEDGLVRNTYIVSTGVADSPTMAGVFQVQTHELNAYASNWDLYMPHFLGIYEAWPGFMNGIHGLPLLSNGQRLWATALGSPASYGCIILDLAAAEDVYTWAESGVVIEIIR